MAYIPEVRADSPFSWTNFPFGVFSTKEDEKTRCGTAIGDVVLDLSLLIASGLYDDQVIIDAWAKPDLSTFAALPSSKRFQARQRVIEDVKNGRVEKECFVPLNDAIMHLPMEIKGFTDFLCSKEHLTNCSAMAGRPNPENFFQVPTAYNGRASSIQPSPHTFHRAKGVHWEAVEGGAQQATFGPSKCIDYELEMGALIGTPIPYGETVDSNNAAHHIFGFVILNDWSAREIQQFEMPPLGPMNSKAYATTISPWVITLDALVPHACRPQHTATLESPFEHMKIAHPEYSTFDIGLEVSLQRKGKQYTICTSNLKYLLWTPFQQLAHQATSACGFRTGDLLGTGTISNNETNAEGVKVGLGCLLEATKGGRSPYKFEDGSQLGYLEDGDSIVINARAGGAQGIGFGECIGTVLAGRP